MTAPRPLYDDDGGDLDVEPDDTPFDDWAAELEQAAAAFEEE